MQKTKDKDSRTTMEHMGEIAPFAGAIILLYVIFCCHSSWYLQNNPVSVESKNRLERFCEKSLGEKIPYLNCKNAASDLPIIFPQPAFALNMFLKYSSVKITNEEFMRETTFRKFVKWNLSKI